jgi:hypothetical protein
MRWVAFGVEPVGVVAVGSNATGVIAIGQLATGVIAVGQLARGVVVVGQLAIGVVAIGQLALGVAWVAGMLGAGARTGFGLAVWKVRTPFVVVLAVVWWLTAGQWLAQSVTDEGGIFRDAPPPSCAEDPTRAC